MADKSAKEQAAGTERPEGTRNVPVFTPLADIYETKDNLILLLEMPGVDSDAISVTLEKRVLTVVGHRGAEALPGYSLSHAEYRGGDYERSFTLAETIDSEGIDAVMKDGVLRLTLPKSKPAPTRTISVKAE